MMNRYIFLLVLAVTTLVSCQKEEELVGFLHVNVLKDSQVTEKSRLTRAEGASADIIALNIFDSKGEVVESFDDHTAFPDKLSLAPGKYTVRATTGENGNAVFDTPFYAGEKEITIQTGVISTCQITCTQANVKVSVEYSDKVKANFMEYKTTVSNAAGSLLFAKGETRSGYFTVADLSVVLQLTNNNGTVYTLPARSITNVKAREHYRLIFDVSDSSDETEGGGSFSITVDERTNEYLCHIKIPLDNLDRPLVSGDGFNITAGLSVTEGVAKSARVAVELPAGLQYLTLSSTSEFWTVEQGLPQYIELTNVSEKNPAVAQKLKELGIVWPASLVGSKNLDLDFTEFTTKLVALNGVTTNYDVKITVRDLQNQEVEAKLTFAVRPNASINTLEANPWAKFAYLSGNCQTGGVTPGFEIRKVGASDWQAVDPALINVNGSDFTAKVSGLVPETDYEFRAVAGESKGSIVNFTTEAMVLVPNLNFDTWTQNKKNWYPNADASNSFWASGNEGVTMGVVNKPANTIPSDDAISGKAAYLKTIAVPFANLAAGNIFTGTYKTNISDPKSSVNFGRPYTGRPTKLKGWYKYKSTPINVGTAPNGEVNDLCQIYVWLKDASGKQIAYGQFSSDVTVTTYTKFSFDIVYTDLTARPATIAVVATSSIYGGDFIGGVDSELYVDEFELLFD